MLRAISGCISVAKCAERFKFVSRVACGVDGHLRRAVEDRARQLEPRARGLEPKAERCETINCFLQELKRVFAPLGAGEATVSSDGECRDAIATAARSDDVQRRRGRSRVVQPVLRQPCLH